MNSRGSSRLRMRSGPAVLVALCLAGCFGGPAPRDHFYNLAPALPTEQRAEPALRGTLEIERFRSDALTRERAILHVDDPDAVQVVPYAYHLWTDTPTRMLQWGLADYLRRAGVAERITLPEMNVEEAWELNGWVDRLVHVTGENPQSVIVEIQVTLRRGRSADLLMSRSYRAVVPVEGKDVESAVRAFNVAVTEIFRKLEADLVAAAG
jgi:ABC-type uncharacterized transport system auxiliary subunit